MNTCSLISGEIISGSEGNRQEFAPKSGLWWNSSGKYNGGRNTNLRVIWSGNERGGVYISTGKDLRDRGGGNAVTRPDLKKEYRGLSHLRNMFDSAVKRVRKHR